jgi:hypothetical protein
MALYLTVKFILVIFPSSTQWPKEKVQKDIGETRINIDKVKSIRFVVYNHDYT